MPATKDTHKRKVAFGLELAIVDFVVARIGRHGEVLHWQFSELAVVAPLQCFRPRLVAQPVADEVCVTSVDEHGDLAEEIGDDAVERLHPVAVEEEVAVDVHVARVVGSDFRAESFHHRLLVEILADPAKLVVTEIAVFAGNADVVWVLAGTLVRAEDGVVAVDRCRDAHPGALAVVAGLDHGETAGESIVHRLAGSLIDDGRIAAFTAGHGAVLWVLGEGVSQAVANKHRLEVDVAVLVRQNFSCKDRDIVSSVRLSSNVEVLLSVLRELLEEEREQSVNVLASSNCVADGAPTVGVAYVDRLVKEDDRRIGVPRVRVVHQF